MSDQEKNKSAFIAIVGRPNVGKSSLLNSMLGQKVSIVSRKPQTTRTRIMGVLTEGETQLVFIDTPGLLQPRNRLGEYMVRSVVESVSGVDTCLLVIEAGKKISRSAQELIDRFRSQNMPAVLAINKIDLLRDKSGLMEQIASVSRLYDFEAVVPVSARTGSGIEELKQELSNLAEPGGHFFDDDTLTDQPERVIASEIVREKLLRLLSAEIPHGIGVVVEHMSERASGGDITDIFATIYCEREAHKAIIIGKSGAMLKQVGTLARRDMEQFFGCRVNLKLWVKVKENWRNQQSALRVMGYDASGFDA
ncbi:GTPase Era [Caproiciproducens sp. NJN-50]|uniref:GTPase Era n=1 Tax=Acutalibacteraceae TaxID=3082771 RepID=UPI000FFE0A3D|nr:MULTISPECIES: GTPase Era [Acutalibacteraceae]QAT50167.1 GTPase Era [Caproiciproducens sp. NJN-50]